METKKEVSAAPIRSDPEWPTAFFALVISLGSVACAIGGCIALMARS